MPPVIPRLITLLACAMLSHAAHAQSPETLPASALTGHWLTQSGNLEVEVDYCGEALCGTVVKVFANNAMEKPGAAPADTRPALGLKILKDFKASGKDEWRGYIYNRENGETYDCVMSLAVGGDLKVHGYRGLRMFGKTQTWTRLAAGGASSH